MSWDRVRTWSATWHTASGPVDVAVLPARVSSGGGEGDGGRTGKEGRGAGGGGGGGWGEGVGGGGAGIGGAGGELSVSVGTAAFRRRLLRVNGPVHPRWTG